MRLAVIAHLPNEKEEVEPKGQVFLIRQSISIVCRFGQKGCQSEEGIKYKPI